MPPRAAKKKKPIYKDILFQVIAGILLGVAMGHFYPSMPGPDGKTVIGLAEQMKPLGDAFINLIKMMIAPIIFCTIVTGVAGMGSMKQVGRVGAKALLYFEVVTTIALIIGLVVVNVYQPGSGMNIDSSTVDVSTVKAKLAETQVKSSAQFFMDIIPHTFVSAFSEGDILQVLLISLLFAAGLSSLGEKGKPVLSLIDTVSHVLFHMIAVISRLAPIGAFGAMAFTVGKYGVGSLRDLGELIVVFYGTCVMFVAVILGSVMQFYCRLNLWQFLKYIKDELVIVLGTASSETVLPRIMEKLTKLGCAKPVVGMVVPTGYSFNLDGTSIYLTMGALFIAYATGTELTLWHQITLLGVLLVTSKGAAGVTGSGFIVLAATLSSMGDVFEPESLTVGLALIFAVDRFMSAGRAITNLIGNGIATIVISKWENALDINQARAILSGKKQPVLETVDQ